LLFRIDIVELCAVLLMNKSLCITNGECITEKKWERGEALLSHKASPNKLGRIVSFTSVKDIFKICIVSSSPISVSVSSPLIQSKIYFSMKIFHAEAEVKVNLSLFLIKYHAMKLYHVLN